ncbi:MAG: PfkB family carbohydrate kinase, partial [Candidatus Bathyarchaeota archaeon]|nr:PfkB family carbohydrate kinase [Candidatus Bathyarchaeota archaeon]
GHVAIDKIITAEDTKLQLGGPPSYISPVTSLLGAKLHTVTKVGPDLPDEFRETLNQNGADLRWSASDSPTTRFVLDYTMEPRGLSVEAVCDEITRDDFHGLPEGVILSPIVGEINEKLVYWMDNIIALDPQGFTRRIHGDGSISLREWHDPEVLGKVSVLKCSSRELKYISRNDDLERGLHILAGMGVKTGIVTLGNKGAIIYSGKRIIEVPTYTAETIDSTGAGDAYLAGFFHEYLKGRDVSWCGAMGSAAASVIVETHGPLIQVSKKELLNRAEEVHNKVSVR